MKKKEKGEVPRLSLHRETLKRLDEPAMLHAVRGGDDPPSTQVCCPIS